jgi:hypothetical protein
VPFRRCTRLAKSWLVNWRSVPRAWLHELRVRNVWAKTRPLEAGFVHNNIDTAHSSAPPRVHVGRGDILGRKPSDLFGIRLDAIVSSWPSH